jgi:hypothetical protein
MAASTLINDALRAVEDYEYDELGASVIPVGVVNSWRLIPTDTLTGEEKRQAIRLNALGNLFYFCVVVMGQRRFQRNPDPTKNLHMLMCNCVMRDGLKDVLEFPRAHFKSTTFSKCLPVWRALPFTPKDEQLLLSLGYPDIYIDWMKRCHKQDLRVLLVSENKTNAVKLGTKISAAYTNNALFRYVFPEVIPDSSCVWTNESMTHKRTPAGLSAGDGEGTYDCIGVGSALQSRHYDLCIQDDLVGTDAYRSKVEMEKTIEYHKLLVGAMNNDSEDANRDYDELVVGNRWASNDLNSYIRQNEKYFRFATHSALGGCCDNHPIDVPIFPEEFSPSKLGRWKIKLGAYLYSCQFLNTPQDPARSKFDMTRLHYFTYQRDTSVICAPKNKVVTINGEKQVVTESSRTKMVHQVVDGDVEPDLYPRTLKRIMTVDPNHAGDKGRCRHAIVVSGVMQKPRRVYVLEAWSESCSINDFIAKIFEIQKRWQLTEIHVETVGAQTYLKFHLDTFIKDHRNKPGWEHLQMLRILDFKGSFKEGAKEERIDSLIPMTERGEIWLARDHTHHLREEMEGYGNPNALLDTIDCFSFGPQIWKFSDVDEEELESILAIRRNRFARAQLAG